VYGLRNFTSHTLFSPTYKERFRSPTSPPFRTLHG